MGWGARAARVIRSPARQDGLSCVIAIPCWFSGAVLRGSGASRWGGPRRRPSLPAGCLYAPITTSTVSDPLLLIDYDTAEQFDLCMSSDVVKTNLKALLQQPLTMNYIRVVKKKLDQVMGDAGQEPPRSPSYRGHAPGWVKPAVGTGIKAPEQVLCARFCLLFASLTLLSASLPRPYRLTRPGCPMSS